MAGEKILIVGAGLGGLAAASCLLKAGYDVEVYEQAPALGEVGAGIQMSANPMHVLRHLGLESDILRLGVQPGAYVFRLHDTGEVIQEFSLAEEHRRQHGAPYVQLHRADLHDLLATAAYKLKPDLIHLNRRATGFTETDRSVTLHFADGSSAEGDILVGADGLKSTIARQIVGEVPATYTGDAAWRITVPIERLPKPFLPQVMSVFMGPGGHAVCYYLRGGALLNFVGIIETELASEESWTQKFPWELLKKDYEGWHPAIQTIIDAADRDQCYRWSLHNRLPVRNWSTKRATLLGDSAHATLPYLAQGAAMAIEDGAVLARALRQAPSIAEGLDLYQRNRVDRTARIVKTSTENRRLFHLPSQEAIRAEFSKRNQGDERNRWLYSYNPLTVELT
ncbi:FAD-dependent monooxygenase [Pseudorhodoplanes sp.]|jgi:salicylate hydroxylase|uniref:FAD-dependent monooxygenase n=1 Tax=Pseudorhodoplanes sp. TaxID=1934341 RepID=UPI002C0F83D7|nr:FAD-dependent monooxygenase [Pseudorhodoplanes sp.]HWV44300.1 FAD-dependent monooxygenase [Pseudorhodoplanes sp.]